MRFFVYISVFLLAASSCQTRDQVERSVREKADTCYYRLMQAEVDVIGEYMRKKDFNDGLVFECREPEKEPYPELFENLDSMLVVHNLVLDNRGNFFVAQDSRLKRTGFYKKADMLLLAKDLEIACQQAHAAFASLEERFLRYQNRYDALCAEHGIVRITHGEYADSLLARLVLWEDSLEEQGRMIGKSRSLLKASGLETLSDEYQKIYAPLSQMEKLHKEFQGQLLLVENQHGRYDSARPDEWYYKGPYLVPRHDVDKTEDEIVELGTMMQQFRDLHTDFTTLSEALGSR